MSPPESVAVPLLGYPPTVDLRVPSSSRRPSLSRVLARIALPLVAAIVCATVYLSLASSEASSPSPWTHRNGSNVDVFAPLEIVSLDGDAKAVLIPLGASLNELHVRDNRGHMRDVVVGYRDPRSGSTNGSTYAYFGAIVGRYANRIANSSFLDPATNETYQLETNEGASTTLHGGKWGYSRAGWSVQHHDRNEITFSLRDAQAEGFPGTVETTATYTLLSAPTRLVTHLRSRVVASPALAGGSPKVVRTPISLSSHVYWNLDGYESLEGNAVAGGMKLWLDADRTVRVDRDLVPTGHVDEVDPGGPLDFYSGGWRTEREVRDAIEDDRAKGLCGKDCTGLDNALVYSNPERDPERDVVMTLSSPTSGIRLKVRTNQPLVHLYSCNSLLFSASHQEEEEGGGGAYPFKRSQNRGNPGTYGRSSCLAVEQEGWIDGVHHASEWNLEGEHSQWYDDEREYEWWSEYEFEAS